MQFVSSGLINQQIVAAASRAQRRQDRADPVNRTSSFLGRCLFQLLGLLICLAGLSAMPAHAESLHDHEHPRVLIVHSYHQGLPWNDGLQKGILSHLGELTTHLDLLFEYLDVLRFPKAKKSEETLFVKRLAENYGGTSIDILVATDDPAYRLLLENRDLIAPGKPLLFAGVNNIQADDLYELQNVAGVAETPSFLDNLQLMRKLHPSVSQLVVIGDLTVTFASNLSALEAANAQLPTPFTLQIISQKRLSNVIADLKGVTGNHLVFLMGRPADDRGNFLPGPPTANAVRAVSAMPVYSAWSFFLGHGIVGGKLVSGEEQGIAVAGLIKRLLAGALMTTLPRVIESPNRYQFDYRELERFKIKESLLPEGSEIINQPPSIYQTHPSLLVSVVGLLVVLLIIIVLLIVFMRLKRRAAGVVEKELHLLQALINAIPFPVFYKDSDLLYRRCNDEFLSFTGLSRKNVLGHSVHEIATTLIANDIQAKDLALLESGKKQIFEMRVNNREGVVRDVIFHKALVHQPDGRIGGIVGAMVDNTERKAFIEKLGLYASMFEHSAAAILVTDAENRIVLANPAMLRMSGYELQDLVGKNPRLLSTGETPPEAYQAMWHALHEAGEWQGELIERRKDGSTYPKHTVISVVRDEQGRIVNFIGTYTDISQQKAAENNLRHLALHDPLTGLPNRASLNIFLQRALFQARHDRKALALLFIDLDRFKVINDSLGHHVGDSVLLEVSQRIRAGLRGSDFLARIGGDEFVVVLTGIETALDALPVIEKILREGNEPYQVRENILHTSPSIGISIFPDDSDNIAELLQHADMAMYAAKEQGRNNFQFFTETMNEAAQERLALERDLRRALKENQFSLVYQPKVEAGNEQIVGVEALIRWTHPQKGNIPPNVFIPLAEDTGLINAIGTWVLDEACRQLAEWRSSWPLELRMAINLSANQLRDESLAVIVAETIERHQLDATLIELEITESMAMSDPAKAVEQLGRLRQLGVTLAIDDFGTGYSSLAYLKYLPIQTLKIDRSFVMNIECDTSDAAISLATLALAKGLGLKTVAEGVETRGQAEFLLAHGCDLLQGYLFGKPETPERLVAAWRDKTPAG